MAGMRSIASRAGRARRAAVSARLETRRFHDQPLEDTASLDLETASGASRIFLTWAADERSNAIEIDGERGEIRVWGDASCSARIRKSAAGFVRRRCPKGRIIPTGSAALRRTFSPRRLAAAQAISRRRCCAPPRSTPPNGQAPRARPGSRSPPTRRRAAPLSRPAARAWQGRAREKIDRRPKRGQQQKPVRPAEERKNQDEINEIAPRRGVERLSQRALGLGRNRGEQRPAIVLDAQKPPIDEARRPQRPESRRCAEPQRPSCIRGQAPANRHACEYDGVNDVVAPEVKHAAPSQFLEFEPRQFAVAAVQDRVGEEKKRPDRLQRGALG